MLQVVASFHTFSQRNFMCKMCKIMCKTVTLAGKILKTTGTQVVKYHCKDKNDFVKNLNFLNNNPYFAWQIINSDYN